LDEGSENATFTRLVFGKAYSNTRRLFADKVRDAIFGLILLAVGSAVSWHWHGLPVAMEQTFYFVLTALGPIGFVVLVVFLWNLMLAPTELAYEANKIALSVLRIPPSAVPTSPGRPPINWTIWRQRSEYTITELAALLAKESPSDPRTSDDAVAYSKLITEDVRGGKLHYIPRHANIAGSGAFELPVKADQTRIRKDLALAWAQSKQFDLEHIR
jgi:hypothetical protein